MIANPGLKNLKRFEFPPSVTGGDATQLIAPPPVLPATPVTVKAQPLQIRCGAIEIVRGDRAMALLKDDAFVGRWNALADICVWTTPYQSPAFARAWYPSYLATYEPLFLIATDRAGRLDGLMPLAIERRSGKLVPAGDCQAEYQGWISHPEAGDLFARRAIASIRAEFRNRSLRFHFLAPGLPIDWVRRDHSLRGQFAIETRPRPIMQFGDGSAVKSSLSKKNNKSRLRALKKLGDVQLKRLTTVAEVEQIFSSIELAHDARRIAVNNIAPFADDPARRAFHLAMMAQPGLIHATALMAGSRVAAAQLNMICGKHVQLGLISYDPLLAEFSPGKMHILMLAKMLHEEGFEWLDITPGDDGYKQRFANSSDEVRTFTIYPHAAAAIIDAAVQATHRNVKQALMQRDILPARMQANLHELTRNGLFGIARNIFSAFGKRISSTEQMDYFSMPAVAAKKLASACKLKRDSLDDLCRFKEQKSGPSRQRFMRDAFDRSEDVLHVYTEVTSAGLSQVGWIAEKTSQLKSLTALQLPRSAAMIVDIQSLNLPSNSNGNEPGDRRELQAFVNALLLEAASAKDVETIYLQVPSTFSALRSCALAVGMTLDRSLKTTWWLGRSSVVASEGRESAIKAIPNIAVLTGIPATPAVTN